MRPLLVKPGGGGALAPSAPPAPTPMRSGKGGGGVRKVINVDLTSGRWPSCPIRRVNHM